MTGAQASSIGETSHADNLSSGPLQKIDPRELQISLTGFLEKNTSLFCKVRACGVQSCANHRCLHFLVCCCHQQSISRVPRHKSQYFLLHHPRVYAALDT